jgi:hypothetical protein
MARRLSKTGLQPVAPILAQALRHAGLDRVMLLAQITQHWEKIAGAQIAAVARPEHIRSRVLFVMVADAIWLQQITFYQAQLLRNIRRVLGDVPLSKLHFVLNSQLPAPNAEEEDTRAFLPLTAKEEQQLLEETAEIADTALRVAIQRAWRRDWQLKTRG